MELLDEPAYIIIAQSVLIDFSIFILVYSAESAEIVALCSVVMNLMIWMIMVIFGAFLDMKKDVVHPVPIQIKA